MAIPAHYIQELVARNDIYDVISTKVVLKRNGRIYKGLCPFHSERTPSFCVYPETQSYYCFGCGAGGDAINFTKETEGLSYIEAIKLLASRSGMTLPDEDDNTSKIKSRIYEMNKIAAKFFYQNLNSDDGLKARSYLRKRALSDKTIVSFGLGYSKDNWSSLIDLLKSKGFKEEEIVNAYLGLRSSKGNIYDAFRGRVMFPIIDLRGNVIAFGGRILDEGGPKYLNSGDTPVFKKSNNLFALNIARKSKREGIILAEGYMDVIALHQAGFDNAVATLGTALTIQQARLVATYTKKVIIAYDSDEAGQKATKKAIDIFAREEVEVQVLEIQGAKDPDEYIKNFGVQSFEALIEGANNALDFELIKLKNKYDIKKADELVKYLTEATKILAKLKNPIEQDVYATRLSRQTGTDKDSIKKQIEHNKTQYYKKDKYEKSQKILKEGNAANIKVDLKQKGNTLPKVFAQMQIIYSLLYNNSFLEFVKEKVSVNNFTDSDLREMFSALKILIENNKHVEFIDLYHNLSENSKNVLSQIMAKNQDIIVTKNDLEHYINSLLTTKLIASELQEKTPEELALRLKELKEKKK